MKLDLCGESSHVHEEINDNEFEGELFAGQVLFKQCRIKRVCAKQQTRSRTYIIHNCVFNEIMDLRANVQNKSTTSAFW